MVENADQVDAIFSAAIELPSTGQRTEFVRRACAGDPALLHRVDQLLTAHFAAGDFLEQPPTAVMHPDRDELAEGAGTVIGPYKLLQQIGEGGMGVVFMAEQTVPIHRTVALKIIKPGMDTRRVIARFEAERQALALMDHPNIAKVLDAGTSASGRPYFVMELVRGVPITEYCDAQQLTIRQRLELMAAVCQGVQHAHQKGVIHRDLKPTNVLVAEYDGHPVPRIIDFGVAKAIGQRLAEKTLFTQFGQIVGTLEYMSPEQARFNQLDVDTRSDVYSLGVLLYELLSGSTPLEKERLRTAAFDEILHMISEEEPPRPSARISSSESLPSIAAHRGQEPKKLAGVVRGDLDWIVMKALEKDRGRRYETASSLAHDIEHFLVDEPVLACPPSAAYRLRKFVRRNKLPFAAAVALTTTLLGGISLSTWMYFKEKASRERAVVAEAEAQANAVKSARLVDLLTTMLAGDNQPTSVVDAALLEEVLSFAGDHANAAQSLNNMGEALRDRGFFAEAEILHRRALRILEELHSGDFDHIAISLNNLSLVQWNQGKTAEAEQTVRKALAMGLRLWGPQEWRSAMLFNNLGAMLMSRGQWDEAEELFQKALVIRRRDLGDDDVNTGETIFHLAELADKRGDRDEAERRYRELLQLLRDNPAAEGRHVAATLMRLAAVLVAAGEYAEAESLGRECIKICENSQPDHWSTFATRSVLGAALLGQEKIAEARPLLLDGYQGMKERWKLIPVNERWLFRDALERIVQYYEAAGTPDQRAQWQDALAKFDGSATEQTTRETEPKPEP